MEILSYTSDNLAISLTNKFTNEAQIRSKTHFRYLLDYLDLNNGIRAKQIVIEQEYISKDYLSDYTKYYSTCFLPYDKVCKRVHFFAHEFTETELKEAIVSAKHAQIWDSYLGFIIVKPIPITILGTTLFKTFTGSDRKFFGIREYLIHVFGKEIKLNSLAFQEQDNVLSACATTAIWTMLNKASVDYHTTLKTPNEITQSAGLTGPDGSRLFPNKQGLSLIQMSQAILSSGLVTEIREVAHETTFDTRYVKELISAYSHVGIPIILVISVNNTDERREKKDLSLHAVTVTGFNQLALNPRKAEGDIQLTCETINKLYVHDDQWGPFARMQFNNLHGIEGPWERLNKGYTNVEHILIPLFPKIRIDYDDVKNIIASLHNLIYYSRPPLNYDFTWEIKLEFSESYKKHIRYCELPDTLKHAVLTMNFPKYLWRATCFYINETVFDILFDATDVSSNMFAIEIIFYENNLKQCLHNLFITRDDFRCFFCNEKYFDFFKNKIQ